MHMQKEVIAQKGGEEMISFACLIHLHTFRGTGTTHRVLIFQSRRLKQEFSPWGECIAGKIKGVVISCAERSENIIPVL